MPDGTNELITVRVSRSVLASAEAVFDAWLDPAQAARFLFATPGGQIIRADIEPVVGGEFCIIDRRDDEEIEHIGEWLELERPSRLVFDLSVNQSPVSRVVVSITPGTGQCEVSITHTMARAWAAHADRAARGWEALLEQLGRVVERT